MPRFDAVRVWQAPLIVSVRCMIWGEKRSLPATPTLLYTLIRGASQKAQQHYDFLVANSRPISRFET